MRQTAEQLPYVGSAVVRSRHGPSPACRSTGRRAGFTLIEVVVAMAILLIVLVPLMDAFARGVAGFKSAQLFTFAQNLAEFQAEDLKSMAPSVLSQLVEGTYPGTDLTSDNPLVVYSNYPYAPGTLVGGYAYDSGEIATEFNLIGLTKIFGDPYMAGESTPSQELPSDVPMLGPNIQILLYNDADFATTQWRYYRAVLHKEAYPLFRKRIQVTRYNAESLPLKTNHESSSDVSDLFDYTITVSTRQSDGSFRVLYVTQGTIGSSFTLTPTTVTVTAPAGGTSWSNPPATGTVTWTVSSTAGVFAYNVRFSSDSGVTYGSPAAVVVASTSTTVSANVNPGIQDAQSMVMVEAVSAKGQVLGSDTSDAFTIGTPGGLDLTVQQPTTGALWTVGLAQSVSWSTPAWMTVDRILVELSTDGGTSYGPAVTLPGDATSTTLTPTVASANCVVRVTAQGDGGAPIVGGVGTSNVFTAQQTPLAITVTAPTASDVWTTGVAGSVTWYLNRSEPTITSFSISFQSGATGTSVSVVGAGSTTAHITPTSASASTKVRVTALNGSNVLAYNDSPVFQVVARLSITVVKPTGAPYVRGASVDVQWTTNGSSAGVTGYDVYLIENGGSPQLKLHNKPTPTGSLQVSLPGGNNYGYNDQIEVVALGSVYSPAPSGLSPQFPVTKN